MEFTLDEEFLEEYKHRTPEFGFNGLGEITCYRSYSREKEDGTKEDWWEICRRVVEGTYSMQKRHIDRYHLGWSESKAQRSAQEMYERMFVMKWLPPGRGLWAMGSAITEEKGLFAPLSNCAFVSTEDIQDDIAKPFCFLMDMSMLGVGVGFDVLGADQLEVYRPFDDTWTYVIPDTREGWVESLRFLLLSYLVPGQSEVDFDYSKIRGKGEPIKTFGGVSSGPEPLKELHRDARGLLTKGIGSTLSGRNIVDIMNMIGRCVVSGNVRRSAEIALGPYDSDEYLDLKDYDKHPERAEFGWTSNNSVFADLGMDYSDVASRTAKNGEPGYVWMLNARKYDRFRDDEANWTDLKAKGVNPCGEQTLESYELCTLVETFPARHDSAEDYMRTLKFAYLYGKSITLGQTHWSETNRVMMKNRRIGCSMSGIAQFLAKRSIHELKDWCDQGFRVVNHYDEVYSNWFAIPRSIKTTSIKPSGSVSLLAGATPGMHYPESRYYIRRIRIAKDSVMLDKIRESGYYIEDAVDDKNTVVVEVPVDVGEGVRSVDDVSMWEQLHLASFLQRWWADNQVSCTVTIPQDTTADDISNALNYFQYHLKAVSFLPKVDGGAYAQMPYEEISAEQYHDKSYGLTPLSLSGTKGIETEVEKFCDSDVCEI